MIAFLLHNEYISAYVGSQLLKSFHQTGYTGNTHYCGHFCYALLVFWMRKMSFHSPDNLSQTVVYMCGV